MFKPGMLHVQARHVTCSSQACYMFKPGMYHSLPVELKINVVPIPTNNMYRTKHGLQIKTCFWRVWIFPRIENHHDIRCCCYNTVYFQTTFVSILHITVFTQFHLVYFKFT